MSIVVQDPVSRKLISMLLLVVFLHSILAPRVNAFTDGPQQNEYTTYETPGGSDLVNLLTGDFTFNLPLMTVPGPETSFPINLFYHSGISLEQEASWVGLGWNLNPGAITRDVVGYPDDAYDEVHSVNVQDPGGSGFVKNYVLYKRTWDSEKGYGGGISLFNILGLDWNKADGLSTGTVAGLTFNKSGIKGYWAENVFNVAMAAASAFSLVNLTASLIQNASKSGGQALTSAASASKGLATAQTAASVGSTLLQGYNSQGVFSSSFHGWRREVETSHMGFRTDYKYWLDDTRNEHAFGALYLGSTDDVSFNESCVNCGETYDWPKLFNGAFGDYTNTRTVDRFKMSAWNEVATSDIYRYVDPGSEYIDVKSPSHISLDQFSVMGPGISGNIQPYRVDIGSLGFTKRMTNRSMRFKPVPYLQEGTEIDKVQFIYPGEISNRYRYHEDNSVGISHVVNSDENQVFLGLNNTKLRPGATAEGNREGLQSKKLIRGKNIKWYTNEEIRNGLPASEKFLDVSGFSRLSLPSKGIGAFSVTKEDGMTYHYSLPVYSRNERNFSGEKGEETTKFAVHRSNNRVAQSWLLTAITGPDFVDVNANGLADGNDFGQWTSFSYGRYTMVYDWRHPYVHYYDDGERLSYSRGEKELYYLDEIKTRTHTALFIKGIRKDGRGAYYNGSDIIPPTEDSYNSKPISQLYLDRIVLLNNNEHDQLLSHGFVAGPSDQTADTDEINHAAESLHRVHDVFDAERNQNIINLLRDRSIQTIVFNYETDPNKQLCKGATNSFDNASTPPSTDATDIYTNRLGKLTLNSVSVIGRSGDKIMPDYLFGYGNNPAYNKDKWGGWGMYSRSGDTGSHVASSFDEDGSAWSLNTITLPLGGELQVEYERDRYSSVSGYNILSHGHTVVDKKGGDIRVSKLTYTDGEKSYCTRYIYTKDELPSGPSSGVVSKEPEFVKSSDPNIRDLDKVYDLPSTSVMYGKVTVLNGILSNDDDYHTKQVFEFETPHHSTVSENYVEEENYQIPGWGAAFSDIVYYRQHMNTVNVRNAKIGKIKSIKIYDKDDNLFQSTDFTYTDNLPSHQGKFSQGSITSEYAQKDGHAPAAHLLQRTAKTYHPYVLKSVRTTTDNLITTRTTDKWDFTTGISLQTTNESANGLKTQEEVVLAYKEYPGMGSAIANSAHSNMMSQDAATYRYKLSNTGTREGLITANSTIWKKNWANYRLPNASGDYKNTNNDHHTWRVSEDFVYQGEKADLRQDGTLEFSDTHDRFDFSNGAANPGWLHSGEVLRYDNYSMPVEAKDRNDIHTVVKTSADHQRKSLEAVNAEYTEVAWSGAENGYIQSNGKVYLDGEVRIGSASQLSTTVAHTGETSVRLTVPNEKGFHYIMEPGNYDANQNYRLYMWARLNPANLALYYKLGSTETLLTPTSLQAGDWYRLEALIPASALNGTSTLEVGCRTINGDNVYVDDFRFQPVDAGMTAYVYNEHDAVWYVLDNENMFTEYQYNNKGELIRTYMESFAYGRVQTSETTQHFKR